MVLRAEEKEAAARSYTRGSFTRDDIVRAIEDEIVAGVRKPGDRIDERALAERFSVSRTPVRDAIGRLASVGLVDVKPRSGSYVAAMDLSDLLQVFEFMADLEGLCARHAAARMDKQELAALKEKAQLCLEVAQHAPEQYMTVNFELHNAIYRGAKNTYLETQTRQARRRVAGYRNYTFRLPGRLMRSAEEHFNIVDAICAGDAEKAERLTIEHTNIKRGDFAPFIAMMAERDKK